MHAGYQAPLNNRMKCWLNFCYFPILGGIIGCAVLNIHFYFSLACFVLLLINNIILTMLYTSRKLCIGTTYNGQRGASIIILAVGLGQPISLIIQYSSGDSREIAGMLIYLFLFCLPILIVQSIIVSIQNCACREINKRVIAYYHQRNPS